MKFGVIWLGLVFAGCGDADECPTAGDARAACIYECGSGQCASGCAWMAEQTLAECESPDPCGTDDQSSVVECICANAPDWQERCYERCGDWYHDPGLCSKGCWHYIFDCLFM